MSAPRTNAAIASDLAEWRKGVSSQPLKAVIMEAIAALQKEPPALPAEVEAVVEKLETSPLAYITGSKAAAMLRRYAQAVAEIPILREAVHDNAQANREPQKKLQAIEERAKYFHDNRLEYSSGPHYLVRKILEFVLTGAAH